MQTTDYAKVKCNFASNLASNNRLKGSLTKMDCIESPTLASSAPEMSNMIIYSRLEIWKA